MAQTRRTLLNGATGTGAGTTYIIPNEVYACTVTVEVNGIGTATVEIEGRQTGGNWYQVPGSADITANGLARVDASGLAEIRANVTAYTSGTIYAYATAVYG